VFGEAAAAGKMVVVIGPVVPIERWQTTEDDVVLADVRSYLDGRSSAAAYRAGHLPGARYVDFDRWLSGPAHPDSGRHPLPDPEVFAEECAGWD
jgi:thiosulfate/3-mercaptopyruvate sulfurtransferase